MLSINIGIGHQDNFVVAQPVEIKFLLHTGAKCRDQRLDFSVLENFVNASFLHIKDFSANRKDRLGPRVSSLTCRATGAITFNNEDFAFLGFAARAIN